MKPKKLQIQHKNGYSVKGRGQNPKPVAIMLHLVPNTLDIESVTARSPTLESTEANQVYVNGVHFYINCEGVICQFADPLDRVNGISLFGATLPLLTEYPFEDPNELFIHVGIDDPITFESRVILEQLLYELTETFNIPLQKQFIVPPVDVNLNVCTPNVIPEELLQSVSAKYFEDCFNPFPDVIQLGFDVGTIKNEICFLREQIAGQNQQIADLVQQVEEQQNATDGLDVSAINLKLQTLMQNLGIVQQTVNQLRKLYNGIEQCVTKICGPVDVTCIEYASSQPILIIPDNQQWVNLPDQLSDNVPPSVLTGPQWAACLDVGQTYTVEGSITVGTAEYCAGKVIKLLLADNCGNSWILEEIETTDTTEEIVLSGMADVTPTADCDSYHLEIFTDDATETKEIINANIKIC